MAPSVKEGFSMAVLRMYAFQLSEYKPAKQDGHKNAQKMIKLQMQMQHQALQAIST